MEFKKFVKFRREKFGAVIFDTLREKVFVTNQTGTAVLKLLEEGEFLENIPSLLAGHYRGDASQIEQDAADFISELVERDLLVK